MAIYDKNEKQEYWSRKCYEVTNISCVYNSLSLCICKRWKGFENHFSVETLSAVIFNWVWDYYKPFQCHCHSQLERWHAFMKYLWFTVRVFVSFLHSINYDISICFRTRSQKGSGMYLTLGNRGVGVWEMKNTI